MRASPSSRVEVVNAGVVDEEGDAECFAAFDLDGHEIDGLGPEFVGRRGEVDEIRGVRDGARTVPAHLRDATARARTSSSARGRAFHCCWFLVKT